MLWLSFGRGPFLELCVRAQRTSLLSDLGKLSFEVASVRPSKGDLGVSLGTGQRGRFDATGVTLTALIAAAYGGVEGTFPRARLVAAPNIAAAKWMNSDLWDVVAKTPDSKQGLAPMLKMLQTLLRDRFHLKMHSEQRQQAVYTLVLVRRDAKLGPKLHRSDTDCMAAMAKEDETGEWPENFWCGLRIQRGAQATARARGITIYELVRRLEEFPAIGKPVIDRTGLKGTWDFEMEFAVPGPAVPESEPTGPSIFTALQDQLGLKLQSTRGPVEVLVIDGVDRPEEN